MTILKEKKNQKVLVTGIAGFIGFHFAKRLLDLNFTVIGIDNLNDYYDVQLKYHRLIQLGFSPEHIKQIECPKENDELKPLALKLANNQELIFYRENLENRTVIEKIFYQEHPDYIVHLAAQAGVRYSLKNPYAYIDSNINGFLNILENARKFKTKHLVFSSSSSVYGANKTMPFSVHHNVDHPVSLYAATKKSNELMAHSYSHLYKIPTTGLRFFTVYGPWGRPDMAYFSFTDKIVKQIPIEVFNNGNMKRDFTYIDDIVEGVYRVMQKIPQSNPRWDGKKPDPATSLAPYRIFNIGNHQPVNLLYFIQLIEDNLNRKAEKKLLPMQKGDVEETFADISELHRYIDFQPSTSIEDGIRRFVGWFKNYYNISSN